MFTEATPVNDRHTNLQTYAAVFLHPLLQLRAQFLHDVLPCRNCPECLSGKTENCTAPKTAGLNCEGYLREFAVADESDLIVTMTWEQRAALATVVDDNKLAAFCEVAPCGDVPDPFGADAEVYEKCARTLDKATDSLISYIKERYLSNK